VQKRTTHINIVLLLLAYGIVLFHSIIPHCNGKHSAFHPYPSMQQAATIESPGACGSEHHKHNHCHLDHDDGLHVSYIKPASYTSSESEFLISFNHVGEVLDILFFSHKQSIPCYIDTGIVRCGNCISATLLRGPPFYMG
jgi:hypothetical protein